MIHLFSNEGIASLRAFIDRKTLLAFDLDGTLAPIVPIPSQIVIPDNVRDSLIQLCRTESVAIITGRACSDARAHLGFDPGFIIGNHGAEGIPGRQEQEQGYLVLCSEWEQQLQNALGCNDENGIFMENKGATLSIHYRMARDRESARLAILTAIDGLRPSPKRVTGKCVENLLPCNAPHKGAALTMLMRQGGYSRAIFVGDDETDEYVFRLEDSTIFGILVGESSSSAAQYNIRGQAHIARLLETIQTIMKTYHEKDTM